MIDIFRNRRREKTRELYMALDLSRQTVRVLLDYKSELEDELDIAAIEYAELERKLVQAVTEREAKQAVEPPF
ncbi:hypothetical protein ACN20G_23615 [Streptomyces sp. BI20]|uniref:hypothetical protein n=1 Tax=Streptomyces sp. BI20 TaxID=3403460 RepID=UPI003C7305F9